MPNVKTHRTLQIVWVPFGVLVCSESPKIKILDIYIINPVSHEANSHTQKISQLLSTPDLVKRKKVTPRRKAIIIKHNFSKETFFSEKASPKLVKAEQKLTESKEKSQNFKGDSDTSIWMWSICAEERVEDMRQCAACQTRVHEECVGLTVEDDEEFVCPTCSS